MDFQTYLQNRPDLLQNWQNANSDQFRAANPNDPNVDNIKGYGSLENYLNAAYGGESNGQKLTGSVSGGGGASGGGFSTLTPSTPTTPAVSSTTPGHISSTFNVQDYLTANPRITDSWNNDPNARQVYGTIENYAASDARVNGTAADKAAVASYTPPQTYQPTTSSGGPGGNFNQTQAGSQVGAFDTTNETNTAQNQVSGSVTQQQQQGANYSNTADKQTQQTAQSGTTGSVGSTTNQGTTTENGTTTQNQDLTTATKGTNTSAVDDTLGFGKLLQDSAPGVQASDATRTGFLKDVVDTGGSQLASQVDQAVRNAGTGSTLVGAGDSANARARGYAAAQVSRNNLDERLSAAGQLAGPTGLQTLSSAANPYLGKTDTVDQTAHTTGTTTGTNSTTGTTNNTGTSVNNGFSNLVGSTNTASTGTKADTSSNSTTGSTTGFQNLLGKSSESSSGTATGQSSQAASGQVPQAQQVQTGGGCVLCTAATELGFFRNLRVLRSVIAYKLTHQRFSAASRGYFFLFTPLAAWLLTKPRLARILYPLARMVVYEELRVSGRLLPCRKRAWAVHWAGHLLCAAVGTLFPVPSDVRNPIIKSLAQKHNIWFSLPS